MVEGQLLFERFVAEDEWHNAATASFETTGQPGNAINEQSGRLIKLVQAGGMDIGDLRLGVVWARAAHKEAVERSPLGFQGLSETDHTEVTARRIAHFAGSKAVGTFDSLATTTYHG